MKTKNEALEYLRSFTDLLEFKPNNFCPANGYILNHNEYSAPEFKPVYYPSLKKWGIKRTVFYYAGAINCPASGRVELEHTELGQYQVIYNY